MVEVAQFAVSVAIAIAIGWVIFFLRKWVNPEIPTANGMELDDEDVAMLQEREANGELRHKLCAFCAGWHIPPVTVAGCPRIKTCSISKNQAVTHVEYWDVWDRSHTVFPWQLPVESEVTSG